MGELTLIEDADDPRIAAYRYVRERDLVGRDGGFIAEGEVVLRACVRGGRTQLASVLLAQKRVEALRDVLEALPSATAVYAADSPTSSASTPRSASDQVATGFFFAAMIPLNDG